MIHQEYISPPHPTETSPPPRLFVLAATDTSGGSGLQADIRTASLLGAHVFSAVTAITAQTVDRALHLSRLTHEVLDQQFATLTLAPRPQAVKIGLLPDKATLDATLELLERTDAPLVLDPVLSSTSGTMLVEEGMVDRIKSQLLPRVDLLTPNRQETEALLGTKLSALEDVPRAAKALLALGPSNVLVKGGHFAEGRIVQDYFASREGGFWLSAPRVRGNCRGTGCTFATAIAAFLGHGFDLLDSIVAARASLSRAMRHSWQPPDTQNRLLGSPRFQWQAVDLPSVTRDLTSGRQRPSFPNCGPVPLGFYPIVSRTTWLTRLLPLGVSTAQLRVKDLQGAELEREIREAIEIARRHGCRLFINDYWQLALKFGAYGVHLGQEDLNQDDLDLDAIAKAGLRLGISTHSIFEAARAHSVGPSYVAFGPIKKTTCKSMRFGPQGFVGFKRWRQLFATPLVAIGGLTLEDAAAAKEAGADGIAVISDITEASDPEARVTAWLKALG